MDKLINIPLEQLPEENNIAEHLDDETLTKIATRVIEDYTEDEKSREPWLHRYNESMKLALQVYESKSWPWKNASNVKYPLMTIAGMQFHARAYPMLVPSKNILMTRVLGKDMDGLKGERAERVQLHMNYQLYDQMTSWEENMDKLLISLPLTGSEFKKVYYDPDTDTNVSELVLSKDLVINYYAKSLEEASRKTQILHLYRNNILTNIRNGLYLDCFDKLTEATPKTPDKIVDVTEKVQGVVVPKVDDDTPHLVLEWHGFLDLDGDGYKEPYIVTVHKELNKVLRIVARFQSSAIDRNSDSEVVRIEPDEYYEQYTFIPSPDGGIYGLGFGTLVGPLNQAVNTLINQLIDSGTINNLNSGFISKHLRLRGGNFSFQLGEWKQVNVAGQDIATGIYPLPTKEPSATLYNLLSFLVSSGERLTSTSDMMVGENPGQNQKATTTQAVIEQGQKVFTAIYKRIRASLTKEFKKLYKLNSIYIDDKEYRNFIEETLGFVEDYNALKDDYKEGGFVVLPSADPNAINQLQKMEKLQAIGQLLALGTIDPRDYSRRYLELLEVEEIDRLMPPPPPGPSKQEQLMDMQVQMAVEEHQVEQTTKLREADRKDIEVQLKAMDIANKAKNDSENVQLDAMRVGIEAATPTNKPETKTKK